MNRAFAHSDMKRGLENGPARMRASLSSSSAANAATAAAAAANAAG